MLDFHVLAAAVGPASAVAGPSLGQCMLQEEPA